MTDTEIRIGIAEKCGWRHRFATYDSPVVRAGYTLPGYYGSDLEVWWNDNDPKLPAVYVDCPDYPNDLNAMHEAVTIMHPNDQCEWVNTMEAILRRDENAKFRDKTKRKWPFNHFGRLALYNATALQRAEAFLRVFGLWKE